MLSLVAKLAALNEAARHLVTAPDLETLFDRVLASAERVFGLHQCAVLLWDEDIERLVIARHRGYRADVVSSFRVRPGEGITGTVFQTGRPLLVADVRSDPRYVPGVTGATSEMAAPLRIDSVTLGVLDAETTAEQTLTDEDMELFAGFAAQAGVATHNILLRQDLEERNRRLEGLVGRLQSLVRASTLIQSDLSIDHVLDGILEQAKKALGFQACAVLLARGDELEILAQTGYPKKVRGTLVPAGRGITGKVFASGRPMLVADVALEPDYIPGIEGGRCEMAVPMVANGRILGVLDAESTVPGSFDDLDMEVFGAFAGTAAVAIQNAKTHARLQEEFRRAQETYYATIHSLAQALEARDAYTRGHSERVAEYAVVLAQALGLSEEDVKLIRHAALLHDIGKIGIGDAVLNKPGRLTDDDRRIIQSHPALGDTILEPLRFLERVHGVVRHHHERFDGTGYPDGLAGAAIPLPARIVAVADAFDAMTSDRPYRSAMTVEEARHELEANAGSQFDPEIVAAFLTLLDSGALAVPAPDGKRP